MKFSFTSASFTRSLRALSFALYATIGVFVALFALFQISEGLYVSHIVRESHKDFDDGMERETQHLVEAGDAIALIPAVHEALLVRDRETLLPLLQQERVVHDVGLMGVADRSGVIVSRTRTSGRFGDNVFLTAPAGRVVSRGEATTSIEQTGFNDQLFLTTARPVLDEGEMIGALFANRLLDDSFASSFSDKHFLPGVEIIFYNRLTGVYGTSIADPNIRPLVVSYFSAGSSWVKDGESGATITFGDGRTYLLENIVFPGLEESPGGALLLIPRLDASEFSNIIMAVLVLCIFFTFAGFAYRRVHGKAFYVLLVPFSLVVVGIAFLALHARESGRLELLPVSYPLYNSTMHLSPEWGIFSVGAEQEISVIVEAGDEKINAISAEIAYDPEALEITHLHAEESECTHFIESRIEAKEGRVYMSCVVLGATAGKTKTLGTLHVVPKKPGTFTLSFVGEGTEVLASDGLGTSVLRHTQDGSYRADLFSDLVTGEKTASSTGRSFMVFSPTHPNESRWYNARTARFSWLGNESAYQYAFDDSKNGEDVVRWEITEKRNVEMAIPGNGIFYFHLQPVGGGPIATYQIRSDHTPPSITSFQMSSEKVYAGDVIRFSFDADDNRSGIQQNYYIDFDNHLFLPAGKELFVPFIEPGVQTITLRVYDNADNYTEEQRTIEVLLRP